MLMVISQSQNSSLGDLFEVLEASLAMFLRKTSDILNASKGEPSVGILGKHRRKTGVHYHKGNDRATS